MQEDLSLTSSNSRLSHSVISHHILYCDSIHTRYDQNKKDDQKFNICLKNQKSYRLFLRSLSRFHTNNP